MRIDAEKSRRTKRGDGSNKRQEDQTRHHEVWPIRSAHTLLHPKVPICVANVCDHSLFCLSRQVSSAVKNGYNQAFTRNLVVRGQFCTERLRSTRGNDSNLHTPCIDYVVLRSSSGSEKRHRFARTMLGPTKRLAGREEFTTTRARRIRTCLKKQTRRSFCIVEDRTPSTKQMQTRNRPCCRLSARHKKKWHFFATAHGNSRRETHELQHEKRRQLQT